MRDQPQRSTWLCPTPGDRARVLDMERRLAPFRTATFGIVALALLTFVPKFGWWPLAGLSFAVVNWVVVGRGLDRMQVPEYRLAAAWCLGQITIATSIALSGGPHSPASGHQPNFGTKVRSASATMPKVAVRKGASRRSMSSMRTRSPGVGQSQVRRCG